MSDKYYSYVKDDSKNPYRAVIDEVTSENFDTSNYIYNRGAITSQMIQPIDDLFVLTIPENTLKNADVITYVDELEITKNNKYVRLSDENSEIYDIVLPIPHVVKLKIVSPTQLGENGFTAYLNYTNSNAIANDTQYNTALLDFTLSTQDENSYTYTTTCNSVCALHEFRIRLQGEYLTNFESARLTITNDKMDFIKLPLSNEFTPEILDYFYDGECKTITSPVSNYAVFNNVTYQLRILHGASNFEAYNKERKVVFRNLPK